MYHKLLLRYLNNPMVVLTSQAAGILNISAARLRVLLAEDRVKGAYKSGKFWLIPLYRGKPVVSRRKKGPDPRWSNPRMPAKTVVHVNKNAIKANHKAQNTQRKVISVKRSSGVAPAVPHSRQILECKTPVLDLTENISNGVSSDHPAIKKQTNVYGHEVEIPGGCRVVYDPKGLKCGAKVWIEAYCDVKIIYWD